MNLQCYDCTRRFERSNTYLLPLEDLFVRIPGEPDPVAICPRCGGLCIPEVAPSVAMEAIAPSPPAAAALLTLNFMLAKSLP